MKKQLVMISLLSAAAVTMFATSADAKTFDDKTDVGVQFKSDDPTIPGENKPYKDNLSLIWKPNSFEFGQQKAVAGIATFNNTITGDQYLVVNDDRPTETTGAWKLTAKMSKLVSDATDTKGLEGAKLTYTLDAAQSYDIGQVDPSTNDFTPKNPADDKTVLGTLDPNAAIQLGDGTSTDMTLEAGSTTGKEVIAKTAANKVKGGVATKVTNVKLVVTDTKGAKAAGKSFSGSVTWTLDDLVAP
ncbi:hypothetical protein A5821_002147 [Enterococcus sp. 7F3_DIV0205]|uniref:WxL domain-containing protein n=1 Tax=Candidatus Enterococcus palustris TaxID=1834189 RepID=A0AAQ3WBJ2_9ENTE|nr:hypothetical protein [Enterococcus sp. 7F3_DIV0205]OTN82586.1 hypothetical protein A5821_002497 [Enterococcus sp. 7F3_DIV0205]